MNRKAWLEQQAKRRREMKKLKDSGWTLVQIAAKFNVSYQAVQSALRRA